jgi:glycine dehydrogenase subunit 1
VTQINDMLLDQGFLGGYDLSKDFTTLKNQMLVAVTEMNTKDEIDALVETLAEVPND